MIGSIDNPCGVEPQDPSIRPLPQAAVRGHPSIDIRVYGPEKDADGIGSAYPGRRDEVSDANRQHFEETL